MDEGAPRRWRLTAVSLVLLVLVVGSGVSMASGGQEEEEAGITARHWASGPEITWWFEGFAIDHVELHLGHEANFTPTNETRRYTVNPVGGGHPQNFSGETIFDDLTPGASHYTKAAGILTNETVVWTNELRFVPLPPEDGIPIPRAAEGNDGPLNGLDVTWARFPSEDITSYEVLLRTPENNPFSFAAKVEPGGPFKVVINSTEEKEPREQYVKIRVYRANAPPIETNTVFEQFPASSEDPVNVTWEPFSAENITSYEVFLEASGNEPFETVAEVGPDGPFDVFIDTRKGMGAREVKIRAQRFNASPLETKPVVEFVSGVNQLPSAVIGVENHEATEERFDRVVRVVPGTTIVFNGSHSRDDDRAPLRYNWSFGDGSPVVHSERVEHRFLDPGSYEVELVVQDQYGAKSNPFFDDRGTVRVYVEDPNATDLFLDPFEAPQTWEPVPFTKTWVVVLMASLIAQCHQRHGMSRR